jgi:hypothetical protein
MLHRRLVSLSRHGGTATGIVCRIWLLRSSLSLRTVGNQVAPVNPFLMTASTSSSDTPRRLSIS